MNYPEFKLENYLAEREFSGPLNICASDVETTSLKELLGFADLESRQLWEDLTLGYTEPKGHPLLREEIGKLYGFDRDKILCFAGAEEGIYCMAHALLQPNDHAVVITPCYQSLESLPAAICSRTAVPLRVEEEWEIDLQAVERAIAPNTKMIILNTPHNPTGSLLTHRQQKELVDLARGRGFWIFSDEVYRLLERDPKDRLPPFASIYEKGLSLNVMSKSYGLAGLRIGWIAAQSREALEKMSGLKHYLSICNSAPSEVLALMALRSSDVLLERTRALLAKNDAELRRFFTKYEEWFDWVPPKAGCISFPRFKGQKSIDLLADELFKEANVLILPRKIFDYEGNHFRISAGRKHLPEALSRFSAFIERHRVSWRQLCGM